MEVIHEVVETPFQVSMDCKHVPDDADYICWNCTVKIVGMAEAAERRAAQLEAERDTAWQELREIRAMVLADDNEATGDEVARMIFQRNEARRHILMLERELADAQSDLRKVYASIVQDTQRRRELLGTIEALIKENRQLQSEIDYLRSTDHAADLAFERAQKIGATYVIDETPLGIALDGLGDEVEP